MTATASISIDPAKYAMVLTTSLNRLRAMDACESSYRKLVKHLGGTKFDHDEPIYLLTILESNGVEDCLWALCATEQNCDVVARLMAADFAEAVLPLFERERPTDMRPRRAIAAARAFAIGEIDAAACTAARGAAWGAIRDAAWAAYAACSASAAAGDAAWAATSAGDAAWYAACAAACAAARDAACAVVWADHAAIVRRYLR